MARITTTGLVEEDFMMVEEEDHWLEDEEEGAEGDLHQLVG